MFHFEHAGRGLPHFVQCGSEIPGRCRSGNGDVIGMELSLDGPFALRPFVMESTGIFRPKAEELIKWLAEQAHPSMGSDADVDVLRSLFTARTRQRLSVALHRGTAFIFRRVCYKGYAGVF